MQDLGPDRPGTGSGTDENGMAVFGLGSIGHFTEDTMLADLEVFFPQEDVREGHSREKGLHGQRHGSSEPQAAPVRAPAARNG